MSGMAEVETQLHLIIKDLRNTADKQMMVCSSADRAQIVDAILAAGFGPVKEAEAKALEEAADELARMDLIAATPVNQVTQAEESDYMAFMRCEGDINWLRARAAAVRGEG